MLVLCHFSKYIEEQLSEITKKMKDAKSFYVSFCLFFNFIVLGKLIFCFKVNVCFKND